MFQISIAAVCDLWKDLRDNHSFDFLCTRRLNQDPLENLFSIIRQKGGKCDNPAPIQFARLFKQVCCQSLLNPKVSANVEFDLSAALASVASGKAKNQCEFIAPLHPPLGVDCPILPSLGSQSRTCLEENGLFYVCGYLLRKLFKFHSCDQCEVLLSDMEPGLDSKTVYLRLRTYSNKPGHRGLICASDSFNDYISQCETIFMSSFDKHQSEYAITKTIVSELMNINTPVICSKFPLVKFLQLFVRMRIYYILKFRNQTFVEENKSKKSKKMKKLDKF